MNDKELLDFDSGRSVEKGSFAKRTFHLKEPPPEINDTRISKFLNAHGVFVDPKTIQELRIKYFGNKPEHVKAELKHFIQKHRKRMQQA